tara:strand:- start:194 stop:478 length:285 start_codon:yes stop_codon:yes gene_type:complete
MNFFEATPEQKKLADFGRKMMDYSENSSMAKLKDHEIQEYNNLSEIGYMLTQVGASFGLKQKDFSSAQRKVIADFVKYEGSNLPQGAACTRTTF